MLHKIKIKYTQKIKCATNTKLIFRAVNKSKKLAFFGAIRFKPIEINIDKSNTGSVKINRNM